MTIIEGARLRDLDAVSVEEIASVLRDALQLASKADAFKDETRLLGSLPELDSMAVVGLITAVEERFGIVIEDDEMSADTFESVGSLRRFVISKLGA